jgi:ATP-dependent Clp protease ATP-binding subunit ClpC
MPERTQQLIVTIVLLAAVFGYMLWKKYGGKFKLPARKVPGGLSGTLAIYTRDLIEAARQGKLDPVVGRQEEIERVIHILSRRTKNNAILLGEPGVGKTAIVEGLARLIAAGEVPDVLKNKRLLSVDMTSLISGTKYRGEFEERMKRFTDEVLKMGRTVILFIDEVHMIAETRGTEGALAVADILKPAMARGDLQVIGATTISEYEKLIKPEDALERRFQPVTVNEPSAKDAATILKGVKKIYEDYHGVVIPDEVIETAVKWSAKYIKERFLPDKAFDLIDEAGAKVKIEEVAAHKTAVGVMHAAARHAVKRAGEAGSEKPLMIADDIKEIVSDWAGVKKEDVK